MAADASRFVLPASPNWYCSTVADCSVSKIYAFGARNCVYLLDVSSTTPIFEGQLAGHAERVTSVSFSKHKLHTSFLASGSDDKTVKIWDLETKLALLEHKAHKAKVTCLTWSPLVTDLVISGDEKGQIVAWRYAEELLFSSCHIQEHIFSIALSYLSENELAVGYKSGLIAVFNVNANDGRISVVNKLQGHSSEIHSLAWCPTPKDHIEFGPLQDKTAAAEGQLLVSGSRDQTVRLWDTFHGKVLSVKQLPKRSSRKDKYDSYGPRDRLWLSVFWPVASPGHVISSSQGGELLLWDLSKEGKDQHQTFSMGHSRIVFNISCDVAGTKIMTVSMDRQIIIWDPQHLRSLHALPTLGGFAYSLAISPLDPGTLGIGVGDNMLRVWQTASSVGPYEALVLWQGIKSKVMVVKWHPNKEGLVAFGTDDGQVGVYNIISKRAESSSTYHKRTVYSLSWGPPCPKAGDTGTLNVYSCAGDGSVLQHRTGHFMDDAVDVNALILKTNELKHKPFGRTDVSWNPDGSVLALGNEDGSIEVYVPPDLLQIGIIITHKKSITTLVWHHGYGEVTSEDSGSCKYWLASGSNEPTVHVHDLGSMLGDSSSSSSRSAPVTECFRQLAGHSGRVTDLSWSPHQCELLLSSSYDGTAEVWDVVKGEALFNFRGHSGRVMCVVWSYLDPDLVYSGGEDGTVRPWRPSLQQNRQPPVSEKKLSHSSGKSSKNKKSKQKGKGKADSAEKESWRQETVSKPEQSAVAEQPATKTPSDHLSETESTSLIQSTEPKQVINTVTNQEEQIGKPQDAKMENKVAAIERDERNECDNEMESKTEVTSENEANDADTYRASEKEKSVVVFKQEPVVPLRSRVTLETVSSSKKKRKVKSMFPLSAVADSKSKTVTREECIELAKMIYGQKQDTKSSVNPSSHGAAESEELVNLGLFADRRSAYRMFAAEGQHHKESGNLDYKLQLEIWKGNLGGALEMAVNSKQLTEWLVSLSPLVDIYIRKAERSVSKQGQLQLRLHSWPAGKDVWLATTRAFADQLESQGQHLRAALYYLACHDIYKAIDVFKKQAMFREAIALAKVRLSPLDPVLFDLYSTWARKLETDNSFEQAAKCYLAVHSSADAVRVLCRRGDQPSLRTALQVATICGESELASSLALRLTHSYLATANWQGCHEILKDFAGVEAHMLNVCVHELLLVTLIQQQAIDQHECEDSARTEISSFLNSRTNTNKPWEKYSYLDVTSTSPWMANTNSRKWFVVCVLEAWYHSGAFKHDLVATLYESLKSYYETISTGTETTLEILSRISLEITLGLLSTLRSDLYSACQYWLQALSHCSKHCLFVLQRELCCILLPHGTQSLENLLGLSHELRSVNSYDESNEKKSVSQLFLHFHAFYYKALIFEIWYRCPNILRIFQRHQCISVEVKEESVTSGSNCDRSANLENSVDDLSPKTEPKKFQNGSAISDYSSDKVGKEIPKAGEDQVAVDEDSRSKVDTKEPFSPSKSTFVVKQDLKSVLEKALKVLLSDHHVKASNLRDLLTEIRKSMLLKRSKQFFQMNSAGSKLNQKKKKAKAQPAHVAQPLGFSPSSSEREPTSQNRNSSSEPVDGTQTESTENKCTALTGHSGTQVEVTGMDAKDILGNEGERQGEISNDQATLGGLSDEVKTVPATETDNKDLATLDGKLPIDLRYVESDTSLESLTEEEERVLRELEQLEFKNLPFPSPLESALTMGNLCARPDGLPLSVPDLSTLGMNALLWAQRSAQTSTDLKGVNTLNRIYGSRKEV